jgi:hypothetical protein
MISLQGINMAGINAVEEHERLPPHVAVNLSRKVLVRPEIDFGNTELKSFS